MKLSERIRRDRQRYAALSPSEKRAFLWDYYKIPILALVCAVLLGSIALLEGLNSRSVAVYAVLVNAAPDTQAAQTCLEDLLTDSGMDLKGKRVDADVSLSLGRENQESEDAQTVQVLAALFGVSGLDFFAADEEIFDRYAVQNAFADLSKLLDPALLEAFSEDLVYATPEGGDRQVAGCAAARRFPIAQVRALQPGHCGGDYGKRRKYGSGSADAEGDIGTNGSVKVRSGNNRQFKNPNALFQMSPERSCVKIRHRYRASCVRRSRPVKEE